MFNDKTSLIIEINQLKYALNFLYDNGYHWSDPTESFKEFIYKNIMSYKDKTKLFYIHIEKYNKISWDYEQINYDGVKYIKFNKILREYKLKRILK